nr:inhibitor of growth protein [Hymenolepis microstoma]
MASEASKSYFAKFISVKQEFPQAIQKFITFVREVDLGKPDITIIEQGLTDLSNNEIDVNADDFVSKIDELLESLEEDLQILQQLKYFLNKDNKSKLQSIISDLTSPTGSNEKNRISSSANPSPSTFSPSNHLKAARRSVQQARRSTAYNMNIRGSKLNSGRRAALSSRGSFRTIRNRGVIPSSSRLRLETIHRRNQEHRQQHQAAENRLSPLPDAPGHFSSDNDSENENRKCPASRSGSSPVHNRRQRDNAGDGSGERIYCLCKSYSYGDMIACDNSRCKIEWFHFACVDVKVQPKGKWFCPKCRGETSKVKRPDV